MLYKNDLLIARLKEWQKAHAISEAKVRSLRRWLSCCIIGWALTLLVSISAVLVIYSMCENTPKAKPDFGSVYPKDFWDK